MSIQSMDPTHPLRTAELRRISGGFTPVALDTSPWIFARPDPLNPVPPVPGRPTLPWPLPGPIPGPTF